MRDYCEFGITETKCYFCSQPRTIRFNEHYIFCPNCSAIYTYLIIQESDCDHIKDGVPVVVNNPWYISKAKMKVHIWTLDGSNDQLCSVCNAGCIADGW